MLMYLWKERGNQMWTVCHLEQVLNYAIKLNWVKAVKAILDSTVSHAIVANLNTNDRCFLVENLIGDFQFDKPSD
jgi:hypothetical protein